jgi:hypothetical protein
MEQRAALRRKAKKLEVTIKRSQTGHQPVNKVRCHRARRKERRNGEIAERLDFVEKRASWART